MKRLYRFSIRLIIVIVGLWVAGFLNFTRPWILPESVAAGVCSGNPIGVYRLLAHGADINARMPGWSFDGLSLFQYFDNTGCQKPFADPALGQILFSHGADVHQETGSGYTLLMLAVGEGSETNVEFLLAKGVDPNRQTQTGETALMVAVRFANMAIVENLLKHGADPNLQNQKSETALMMAAGYGSTATVISLLKHGADPGLRDKKEQTAADHAKVEWRRDAMALLENLPAQE
ncbi:ankyrin repeat domain-containing protein [Rhizobium sp. XQZ8]|uniref:ankyrin repeat domain-containing protein n=1 Tax=Rhizobium populisoli TaxID=2859785 RepID=UPI001C682840|nr:ankyrin repeat domain-containing protein [Rhizobium populisoli]MBW6423257.1 ankyrin repeat domain-containing protein [Rhizobium populisoli]